MQLLSLGQLLGAVAVQPVSSQFQELVQRPEMHRLVIVGIVLLLVSQAVRILSWWVSSMALGRKETATIGNAVNVWIGMLAFLVVGILAVGAISYYVAQVREPWRIYSTWGGVTLLSLVTFFLIPMKIYAIGFWRALGIMILATGMEGIVMAILLFATSAVFLSTQDRVALQRVEKFQQDQLEQWETEMDRLTGRNLSAEITRLLDEAYVTPRPSLWKREATVRTLQKKLSRQRRNIPPGNPEAAAIFRQQLDRYLRLLHEVKAERANTPANQAAAYFPAENCTSLVT